MFTTAEEDGLLGSASHVRALVEELGGDRNRFHRALVLDPVGHTDHREGSQRTPIYIPFVVDPPSTGDFVALLGNGPSAGLAGTVEDAIERYAPDLDVYALERLRTAERARLDLAHD